MKCDFSCLNCFVTLTSGLCENVLMGREGQSHTPLAALLGFLWQELNMLEDVFLGQGEPPPASIIKAGLMTDDLLAKHEPCRRLKARVTLKVPGK